MGKYDEELGWYRPRKRPMEEIIAEAARIKKKEKKDADELRAAESDKATGPEKRRLRERRSPERPTVEMLYTEESPERRRKLRDARWREAQESERRALAAKTKRDELYGNAGRAGGTGPAQLDDTDKTPLLEDVNLALRKRRRERREAMSSNAESRDTERGKDRDMRSNATRKAKSSEAEPDIYHDARPLNAPGSTSHSVQEARPSNTGGATPARVPMRVNKGREDRVVAAHRPETLGAETTTELTESILHADKAINTDPPNEKTDKGTQSDSHDDATEAHAETDNVQSTRNRVEELQHQLDVAATEVNELKAQLASNTPVTEALFTDDSVRAMVPKRSRSITKKSSRRKGSREREYGLVVARLTSEIESLQGRIKEESNRNETSDIESDAKARDLEDLQSRLKETQENLETAKRDAAESKLRESTEKRKTSLNLSEIDLLKSEKSSAEKKLEEANKNLDDAIRKQGELATKLADVEAKSGEADAKIVSAQRIQSEADARVREAEEEARKAEEQVRAADDKIREAERLRSEAEHLRSEAEKLRSEAEDAQKNAESTRLETAKQKSDAEEIARDATKIIQSAQNKQREAEEELNEKSRVILRQLEQKEQLGEQLKQKEQERNDLERQLAQAQAEHAAELAQITADFERKAADTEENVKELQSKLEKKERNGNKNKRAIGYLRKNIEKLSGSLKDTRSKISASIENERQNAIAEAEQFNQGLESALSKANEDIERLSFNLDEAHNESSTLKASLDEATKKYERIVKDFDAQLTQNAKMMDMVPGTHGRRYDALHEASRAMVWLVLYTVDLSQYIPLLEFVAMCMHLVIWLLSFGSAPRIQAVAHVIRRTRPIWRPVLIGALFATRAVPVEFTLESANSTNQIYISNWNRSAGQSRAARSINGQFDFQCKPRWDFGPFVDPLIRLHCTIFKCEQYTDVSSVYPDAYQLVRNISNSSPEMCPIPPKTTKKEALTRKTGPTDSDVDASRAPLSSASKATSSNEQSADDAQLHNNSTNTAGDNDEAVRDHREKLTARNKKTVSDLVEKATRGCYCDDIVAQLHRIDASSEDAATSIANIESQIDSKMAQNDSAKISTDSLRILATNAKDSANEAETMKDYAIGHENEASIAKTAENARASATKAKDAAEKAKKAAKEAATDEAEWAGLAEEAKKTSDPKAKEEAHRLLSELQKAKDDSAKDADAAQNAAKNAEQRARQAEEAAKKAKEEAAKKAEAARKATEEAAQKAKEEEDKRHVKSQEHEASNATAISKQAAQSPGLQAPCSRKSSDGRSRNLCDVNIIESRVKIRSDLNSKLKTWANATNIINETRSLHETLDKIGAMATFDADGAKKLIDKTQGIYTKVYGHIADIGDAQYIPTIPRQLSIDRLTDAMNTVAVIHNVACDVSGPDNPRLSENTSQYTQDDDAFERSMLKIPKYATMDMERRTENVRLDLVGKTIYNDLQRVEKASVLVLAEVATYAQAIIEGGTKFKEALDVIGFHDPTWLQRIVSRYSNSYYLRNMITRANAYAGVIMGGNMHQYRDPLYKTNDAMSDIAYDPNSHRLYEDMFRSMGGSTAINTETMLDLFLPKAHRDAAIRAGVFLVLQQVLETLKNPSEQKRIIELAIGDATNATSHNNSVWMLYKLVACLATAPAQSRLVGLTSLYAHAHVEIGKLISNDASYGQLNGPLELLARNIKSSNRPLEWYHYTKLMLTVLDEAKAGSVASATSRLLVACIHYARESVTKGRHEHVPIDGEYEKDADMYAVLRDTTESERIAIGRMINQGEMGLTTKLDELAERRQAL